MGVQQYVELCDWGSVPSALRAAHDDDLGDFVPHEVREHRDEQRGVRHRARRNQRQSFAVRQRARRVGNGQNGGFALGLVELGDDSGIVRCREPLDASQAILAMDLYV